MSPVDPTASGGAPRLEPDADPIASNRALWEEWTRIHETGDFYDLARFVRDPSDLRVRPDERADVGPVEGKRLLHLQCHFGLDTLSWARLGARVTGLDFSRAAIALARDVATRTGLEATFIESSIEDAPRHLEGAFDVVYTTRGVLGWNPDIRRWAAVACGAVAPGGILYLREAHPLFWALDDGLPIRPRYRYWEGDTLVFPVEGSYADRGAAVAVEKEHGWNHGLGEIVSAVAAEGLVIELLREEPFLEWPADGFEERDGRWYLPGDLDGTLPLSYALRARRP